MEYLSIKEAAEKWQISEQSIRRFCRIGKIPGAIQDGSNWLIPEKARKPRKVIAESESLKKLHPTARTLVRQKTKKAYHGLYDYVVINLTYSSSRMSSNRLTRNQVETIFKKGKVSVGFEAMKVSDVIEILNHVECVDYVLDHINTPLSLPFIRKLHMLLTAGTVDERRKKVTPGEYRPATYISKNRALIPAAEIKRELEMLVDQYEALRDIERRDVLDFHVAFEAIMPFEDYNGRVGRLILFKECLRHDIMPFIIDDKRRNGYLSGIKQWAKDRSVLTEVVVEAQERFDAQISFQRLAEHGQNFLPENYIEYSEDED